MVKNLDPRWLVTAQLNETGGDPSLLFEIIENIIERRDWERLPDDGNGGEPVGTFRRLIEAPPPAGCNLPANKLLKLLEIEHRYEHQDSDWRARMDVLRQNVKGLLEGELEPVNYVGRPSKDNLRNTKIKSDSDDVEYAIRRLKRDAPELAERVIKGEISANAAAVEAGFRPERVAVRLDNMQSAANTLASRLTNDQLDDLIACLVDARGRS